MDEYCGDDNDLGHGSSLEEVAANTFASALLMPRPSVLARFSCRAWTVNGATAVDLFRVATELDVGYGTLCKHLRYGLGLVDDAWLKNRSKFAPKALRTAIAPRTECPRLVVLDQHWPKLPVDLEVGDCFAVPGLLETELPSCLLQEDKHGAMRILRAAIPGGDKGYRGRSTSRHSYCKGRVLRIAQVPLPGGRGRGMSIVGARVVESSNISEAWGRAFLQVMRGTPHNQTPMVLKSCRILWRTTRRRRGHPPGCR